jgi:hypothetical protein
MRAQSKFTLLAFFAIVSLLLTSCSFDTAGITDKDAVLCGDGRVDPGEMCDGADLDGESCQSRGYSSGQLGCTSECGFDVSMCVLESCGNSTLDPGEACDGSQLGGRTCVSLGFDGGDLSCSPTCHLDTSGCQASECGDGVIGPGEECDGSNLRGLDCASLGEGFSGGSLGCTDQCLFDVSGCESPDCGDGQIDSGEDCDPPAMGAESCGSLGYYGGVIGCNEACRYDLADCEAAGWCGDGIRQTDHEECDGADFGADSCQARGYYFGTLVCNGCVVDDSGCSGTCGDGTVNGAETCDHADLDGATCQTLGFAGGQLGCLTDCTGYDTTSCTTQVGFGEPCTAHDECSEGFCVSESQHGWPGGFCTKTCTYATDCASLNALCASFGSGADLCIPSCTGNQSCRPGYLCWTFNSGAAHGCLPYCWDDAQCQSYCNRYTGECNVPEAGNDNGASSNCKSGVAFSLPNYNYYCFSYCDPADPHCPDGDVCAQNISGQDFIGACMQDCVTSADCRVENTDAFSCGSMPVGWGSGGELICYYSGS